MLLLIKYTLLYGIVLMLVALGGMFSEHSGIINIALEGIMVIGGVAGVLTLTMLPASLSPFLVVLISILVAALAGVIYSLLLAFASINLKADQTIGGTALNLLATAIAVVISKYFSESGSAKLNYSNKPFLFSIGGLELSVFVPLGLILLVVSYIVLYKTRFGLRLRACGEHPQAADSVGINVYKMRYAGVILSGALGAIGGLAYIVPPVQTWNFEVGVAGAGFLALAVMIFGQWKPLNIAGASLFFAVFRRGITKLFFPTPLRTARSVICSAKYIGAGLRCLLPHSRVSFVSVCIGSVRMVPSTGFFNLIHFTAELFQLHLNRDKLVLQCIQLFFLCLCGFLHLCQLFCCLKIIVRHVKLH